MGLFDFMKKKGIVIASPAEGECVPLSQVNDPTFSGEVLGKGVAIIPEKGMFYAPADGEIGTIFPTGHAVALTTEEGVEVLIHIGLDTVKLEGKHFRILAQTGQKVKKGDALIEADLEAIRKDGYDCSTPVIICNTTDYAGVTGKTGIHVKPGDACMEIEK